MKPIARTVLALILLSSLPALSAAESSFRIDVILDADVALTVRQEHLSRLRAAADAGGHSAQCVLGRLGWQKHNPTNAPRDFDYGDAVGYLNACVFGGDLDAMLVLAESELVARKPLEAMIWVQAYLKLAQAYGSDEVNSAAPYKAGLIARIEKAYYGKRPPNEEILEYVAGLIDHHGERILQACDDGGRNWLAGLLPTNSAPIKQLSGNRALIGRHSRDYTAARDQLAYASYIIEINEDGSVERALAIESYPLASAARRLDGVPRSRRFNAVAAGTGPRYAWIPVIIDNKAYDLMPDAPATRRPRVDI